MTKEQPPDTEDEVILEMLEPQELDLDKWIPRRRLPTSEIMRSGDVIRSFHQAFGEENVHIHVDLGGDGCVLCVSVEWYDRKVEEEAKRLLEELEASKQS